MKCVILAGGRIADSDPLYPFTGGKPKALLKLGDMTLLEWVIKAMRESSWVDEIAVVGVERQSNIEDNFPVNFLPDSGSIVSNGFAGLAWARQRNPDASTMMFCTADIPAINGAIVDNLVEVCQPFDRLAYYSFVTRETMNHRFPGANRTYSKLDGRDVAGCDIVIARSTLANVDTSLSYALENARKQPWKLARLVGTRVLVRFLMGKLTVAEVESVAERVLGGPVKILVSNHAELAMDVDKPSHVEILRAEFERSP